MPCVRYKLDELLQATQEQVLGRFATMYSTMGFSALWASAIDAWNTQLPVLQSAIGQLVQEHPSASNWNVLFEYSIPLRDRRPDVLILAGNVIFVIEFKIGADTFDSAARWQVQSYALDLRDFHPKCVNRTIIPILVATSAPGTQFSERTLENQLRQTSFPVQETNCDTLGPCICHLIALHGQTEVTPINPDGFEAAVYCPTPTIIQAAQALFGGHRVQDISHAFSDSLETTSAAIVNAIKQSKGQKRRTICFVTGIPGSGKTLVGLNAVHSPALLNNNQSSAIFLSGNGPLVKVIRESLAREQVTRGVRKDEARDIASAFIANVHGFLKTFGIEKTGEAPSQNAIIFDEAQRAWSADAVKKAHGINSSEPAMVLDIMKRVPIWATVIALVGGGQEINTGEAGLPEWGRALAERADDWQVLVSSEALSGGTSVAGQRLFPDGVPANVLVTEVPALHLSVDVRSHRAKFIGQWVNEILSDIPADQLEPRIDGDFPVLLTRDLNEARRWLRERQEKNQRTGLLASSGAIRLRAHGMEVSSAFRKGVSYANWFLNSPGDVRSSYQLEIAATEFDCQGLEIDWAGICWGGDFVVNNKTGKWEYRNFKGNTWQYSNDATKRQYIINKYRVLLTRARRGMIIWIPSGTAAAKDEKSLDATAERLQRAGVPLL
jgi:hypothetical protein